MPSKFEASKTTLAILISSIMTVTLSGCNSGSEKEMGLQISGDEHVSVDLHSGATLSLDNKFLIPANKTWGSTDENVLNVTDGVITPIGEGQATVTVTSGEYSDFVNITVADIDSKKNESDENFLESWELVKAYNFNSDADLSDWYFEEGNEPEYFMPRDDGTLRNQGWGNLEKQFFTKTGNAEVKEGNLVITAKKETSPADRDLNTFEYTSARMISRGGFDFEKGRLEIRAKMPEGKGLWPALWLLGSNFSDLPDGLRSDTPVQWPNCGEIDMMEMIGDNTREIKGTLHAPQSFAATGVGAAFHLADEEASFSESFHTYALEWDDDELEWYIDGRLFHVVNKKELEAMGRTQSWVFDHEFFLIMNVSVGGTLAGEVDTSTWVKPTMEVDYVRVYQDTNSSVIPEGEEIWDTDNERKNEFVPEIKFGFGNGGFSNDSHWNELAKSGSFNIKDGVGIFDVDSNIGSFDPFGSYIYAFQGPFKIKEGKSYLITLDAKSTIDREIAVYIGDGFFSPMLDDSYQPIETMGVFSVTQEYQSYSIEIPAITSRSGRLFLSASPAPFSNLADHKVTVDNVIFEEIN